jgi:hypothetical protein
MTQYTDARAVVIGGSIGGLTVALLLRDLGFTVEVYERSSAALSDRGSGIVLQPDTVRWFTERSGQSLRDLSTSTHYVQYLNRDRGVDHREERTYHYTAWGTTQPNSARPPKPPRLDSPVAEQFRLISWSLQTALLRSRGNSSIPTPRCATPAMSDGGGHIRSVH